MKQAMIDGHKRAVDYLRVSVTDRCNLNCTYCKTPDFRLLKRDEILSLEESVRIVRIAASLGISKVRITGGEPLIRKNIIHFIEMVRDLPDIDELSLTTNGTLLAQFSGTLRDAGVKRVNISLDTLKRERFKQITSQDKLDEVLHGIEVALATGFSSVKLNVVVIKDMNDDEILDFARLTFDQPLSVRFIEHMPIRKSHSYVSLGEIENTLRELGTPIPTSSVPGAGPARYVRYEGAKGTIGIIAPMSRAFCDRCNRLRLTVDGRLLPCLMGMESYDVKLLIRNGASDEEIEELIVRVVKEKPLAPASANGAKRIRKPMASIGG